MTGTEVAVGVDQRALLADLRKQVAVLEDDLRARSESVDEFATALRAEYDAAFAAKRTAATFGAWRDERVTQVAAAWVLGTVFVRFCEDNGLISEPFLAGPGERLAVAQERHEAHFRANPAENDRDWIIAAFDHLASCNTTVAGLFDRAYNPLWEITPSFEAASALVKFWRRLDASGGIVHDFTDRSWDTRFLGDLYQDLSEHARKTYALLQTPEFVEEFILDLTLTPALKEFGLEGLRTIDPACGSGHFLLGIFHRLFDAWQAKAPGTDRWALVRRALESVHGCDKNPFAASIARFRLLIGALKAGRIVSLQQAQDFPINVAVGDSLLHGRGAPVWQQGELFTFDEPYTYRTEDVDAYIKRCDLLGRASYHVVVGNPPYITPKDKQENENYRIGYKSCSRIYALSIPFAECLFKLAIRGVVNAGPAGFVGQITANSFMKREFGRSLIEEFFSSVSLTHVIDTSGAHVPGHGTPTVILIGRNIIGREEKLRVLLGRRGEPSQPAIPAKGRVWCSIIDQVSGPEGESEWVTAVDVERSWLLRFPWSLQGGGASEVFEALHADRPLQLSAFSRLIGRTTHTGNDDAYFAPRGVWRRMGVAQSAYVPLVEGNVVRDWAIPWETEAIFPYGQDYKPELGDLELQKILWRNRVSLSGRREPGGTHEEVGLTWYEWSRWHPDRFAIPLGISFPFVATHNHFALDRGGNVFNRTSPVIKLVEGISENEHFVLLGVLNSSTACFWLKQVCHGKGNGGVNEGLRGEEWEEFFEFTGTKLQEFPLPTDLPLDYGRALDSLAHQLAAQEPSAIAESNAPTRAILNTSQAEHARIRAQAIALQEELDWDTYRRYDLLTEAEATNLVAKDDVPTIALGERAFEIVMARKMASGDLDTAWFTRHNSTPITDIPTHWPQWYRDIVQARIDTIENRKDIALIERPECKRRWATEPWAKKEERALRTRLLDRTERDDLWFVTRDGLKQPRTLTINQLADRLRDDQDFTSVAALYAADHLNKPDASLADVLEKITADQHVPHLAALRYKDPGLRKRQQWEEVWELQRKEDKDNIRLDIPVPPKYSSADFRKTSYWSQRGKLDVPKERFISYPDANPEADDTLLLGWAGWDHKDQAQALVNIVNDRTEQSAWTAGKLTPILAGLHEVLPWVKQWHSGYDADWGGDPAEEYTSFLATQRAKHGLTDEDLTGWRPQPATRGRTRKAST